MEVALKSCHTKWICSSSCHDLWPVWGQLHWLNLSLHGDWPSNMVDFFALVASWETNVPMFCSYLFYSYRIFDVNLSTCSIVTIQPAIKSQPTKFILEEGNGSAKTLYTCTSTSQTRSHMVTRFEWDLLFGKIGTRRIMANAVRRTW